MPTDPVDTLKTVAKRVRRELRDRAGIDVRRVKAPSSAPTTPKLTKSSLVVDVDPEFEAVLGEAVERTTPGAGLGSIAPNIRNKLYTLRECARTTAGIDGLVAECGCFRGLSTHVTAATFAAFDGSYTGADFHVFDSFDGLSELAPEDRPDDEAIPVGGVPRAAGLFAAGIDVVRDNLSAFPDITLHKGWVPEILAEAPDERYRFVHLDLDLYEPIRDSLAYFWPRLAPGGLLVVDDDGSIRWPGVKRAVDEHVAATGAQALRLGNGQAIVLPRR